MNKQKRQSNLFKIPIKKSRTEFNPAFLIWCPGEGETEITKINYLRPFRDKPRMAWLVVQKKTIVAAGMPGINLLTKAEQVRRWAKLKKADRMISPLLEVVPRRGVDKNSL